MLKVDNQINIILALIALIGAATSIKVPKQDGSLAPTQKSI
jgi:hypothetical protein